MDLKFDPSPHFDNIDNSIILKRPLDYTPEEGCKFIIHFAKARVSTSNLNAIADTQFQLREDEQGALVWTWGGVKEENLKQVLRLLDEGITQNDICDQVGLSKGYVSKLKAKSIEKGFIGKNGKLTPTGLDYLHGQTAGNF